MCLAGACVLPSVFCGLQNEDLRSDDAPYRHRYVGLHGAIVMLFFVYAAFYRISSFPVQTTGVPKRRWVCMLSEILAYC